MVLFPYFGPAARFAKHRLPSGWRRRQAVFQIVAGGIAIALSCLAVDKLRFANTLARHSPI